MSPGDMTEVERSFFDKMRRLRESINEGEMVARDMFNSDIWDAEDIQDVKEAFSNAKDIICEIMSAFD